MALVTIEGPMGSGKTGLATWIAYQDFKKQRKIYCNYHVTFPYTYFDQELFFQLNDKNFELDNCTIVADEGYLYMDARTSMSQGNRVINYYAMQTRKRNVDMIITTHSFDRIDKRIRQAVTTRIAARYIPEVYAAKQLNKSTRKVEIVAYNKSPNQILLRNKKGEPIILRPAVYRYRLRSLTSGAKPILNAVPAAEIRALYNTNEVVSIPDRLLKTGTGN